MARSLLSHNAQLVFLSMKSISTRVLRLGLCLVCALFLPRLVDFLTPLSSLHTVSTFILANFLVLAIVLLSSASSCPSCPYNNNPSARPSDSSPSYCPPGAASAQQKQCATGSLNMVRSKSDPGICTREASKTCKKVIRRTEGMDRTPLNLGCVDTSSSVIVIKVPSFESDDLSKRCDNFIANNHEKWRKERRDCIN